MRLRQQRFVFAISALAAALWAASLAPCHAGGQGPAIISNPGLGEYAGFRIVVDPSGHASAVDGAGRTARDLSYDVVQQFFTDLSAASRLAPGGTRTCTPPTDSRRMTAADAAEAISISWKGRRWTGLACTSDPRAIALASDAKAIEQALYVQAYRTRPMYVYAGNHGAYAPSAQTSYGPASGYGATTGGYSSQPFSSMGYGTSPYSGYPAGNMPWSGLPSGSIGGSLPSGSLPSSSPYTGLPSASLPVSSPYSGGPYGASPYSGSL